MILVRGLLHALVRSTFFLLQNTKVTVNDFLDVLMSDPGPPCLIWLPLYHRVASVESGRKLDFDKVEFFFIYLIY